MTAPRRAKAHENFCKDKVTTIVATVAFGMGIDKPDVRFVIHYGGNSVGVSLLIFYLFFANFLSMLVDLKCLLAVFVFFL